jgi:hypothetical protein
MPYQITYARSALKALRKLDHDAARRILRAVHPGGEPDDSGLSFGGFLGVNLIFDGGLGP